MAIRRYLSTAQVLAPAITSLSIKEVQHRTNMGIWVSTPFQPLKPNQQKFIGNQTYYNSPEKFRPLVWMIIRLDHKHNMKMEQGNPSMS